MEQDGGLGGGAWGLCVADLWYIITTWREAVFCMQLSSGCEDLVYLNKVILNQISIVMIYFYLLCAEL